MVVGFFGGLFTRPRDPNDPFEAITARYHAATLPFFAQSWFAYGGAALLIALTL